MQSDLLCGDDAMDREADIGTAQLTLEDRHRLLRPTAHHPKSQIGQGTTCGSHHAGDPRGLGDAVLRDPEDDDRPLLALSTTPRPDANVAPDRHEGERSAHPATSPGDHRGIDRNERSVSEQNEQPHDHELGEGADPVTHPNAGERQRIVKRDSQLGSPQPHRGGDRERTEREPPSRPSEMGVLQHGPIETPASSTRSAYRAQRSRKSVAKRENADAMSPSPEFRGEPFGVVKDPVRDRPWIGGNDNRDPHRRQCPSERSGSR